MNPRARHDTVVTVVVAVLALPRLAFFLGSDIKSRHRLLCNRVDQSQ